VAGPTAPIRAAFVQARNAKTKNHVMVLSDNNGRYRIENLPAVIIRSKPAIASEVIRRAELFCPQTKMFLSIGRFKNRWCIGTKFRLFRVSTCFPKAPEISSRVVVPAATGSAVHQRARDENAWRVALKDQMTRIGGGVVLGTVKNDQDVNEVAAYGQQDFRRGSRRTTDLPCDLPNYVDWMKQFSDDALKIVYVM